MKDRSPLFTLTFEHADSLPTLPPLEGDVGNVILDNLEAVGKEPVEFLHAQWERRTGASGVQRRIDEPHTHDQAAGLQG